MEFSIILLLSLIVFSAHFIGALTGFGCTVLALPFTVSLIGIEYGKPVLIVLGFLQCLVVAIESYRYIDWKEVKKIVILVSIGMPFGILLYNVLPKEFLLNALNIFMILISIKGFLELKGYEFKTPKDSILNFILFNGGIIHGAFVSGGPLLMIYSSEKIKEKNIFRASMCMIWVILNFVLISEGIIGGTYVKEIWMYIIVSLPALFFGTWLGGKLSNKVNQTLFSYTIYTVLMITAIINLI